jgi:type IV pilus modification protein PilV
MKTLFGSRAVDRARGQSGFSLIEIMCAILILGIALVGLTEGMTTALRSTKESEIQTAAALLAAGQIENLRADGFVVDGDTDGDGDGALSNFHWVQVVSATDTEGLHNVKVTVELADSGQQVYELQTLLFDPPVTSAQDPNTRKDSKRKERSQR